MRQEQTKPDCYFLIVDQDHARQRLQMAVESLSFLRRYRDNLRSLERCPNIHRTLAEKAYEAEGHGRLLLRYGLEALNELKDSGALEHHFASVAQYVEQHQAIPFADACSGIKDIFRQELPTLDTQFIDELLAVAGGLRFEIAAQNTELSVTLLTEEEGQRDYVIATKRQPGDIARIGIQQFFSEPTGGLFSRSVGMFASEYRHESGKLSDTNIIRKRVDPYASIVGCPLG
jgi:hypothetical protein